MEIKDPRIGEILKTAGEIAALGEKFGEDDPELAACLRFASRSLASLAEERNGPETETEPEKAPEKKPETPAEPDRKPAPEKKQKPRRDSFEDDMIRPLPQGEIRLSETGDLTPRPAGTPYLRFSHDHSKTRAEIREGFREAGRIFPNPEPRSREEHDPGSRIFDRIARLAREFLTGGGDLAGKTRLLPDQAPGITVRESCDSLSDIARRFFADRDDDCRRSPVFRFKRILKRYGSSPEEWGTFAPLPAALSEDGKSRLLLITDQAFREKKA